MLIATVMVIEGRKRVGHRFAAFAQQHRSSS
jgi:hypothetical protein